MAWLPLRLGKKSGTVTVFEIGKLYRAGTGCTVSPDILPAVEATGKLRALKKKKNLDKKPKKARK